MISKSIYLSTHESVASNVQLLLESFSSWGVGKTLGIQSEHAHNEINDSNNKSKKSNYNSQSVVDILEVRSPHKELLSHANDNNKTNNISSSSDGERSNHVLHFRLAPFTVDVYLQLHNSQRITFLEHAHSLYNAAAETSLELCLNVIPVLETTEVSFLHQNENEIVRADNFKSMETSEHATPMAYVNKYYIANSPLFQPSYSVVALGGTFDRLHAGHKLLLTTALLYAVNKVLVGVTAEGLLTRKKFAEVLEPLETRKQNTIAFLSTIRKDCEVEVFAINDVAGGMDCNVEATALVVSPETERSLDFINAARKSNQLPALHKILIPFITTSDGKLVNSTLLRERALALTTT